MKEIFEKIIERLEVEVEYQNDQADESDTFEEISVRKARQKMGECYEHAIEIVNQVAEEYVPDKNVGENEEFCEWRNNGIADEWNPSCEKGTYNVFGVAWFKRCPYCGKEIKVVE